ncbi:MAG: hypothetical protein HZR80_18010 [Candidatus Heimdallarchaeota archaeon]
MTSKIVDSITKDLLGQDVIIEGMAYDAKGGACIKLKDGDIVYIKNKLNWETEYLEKRIVISSTLNLKKMIPDPEVSENGAISTGAIGKQYVLEKIAKIKIVD